MGSRLRKLAISLLFATVFPFAFVAPTVSDTALAVDCPHGTSWDTVHQVCR